MAYNTVFWVKLTGVLFEWWPFDGMIQYMYTIKILEQDTVWACTVILTTWGELDLWGVKFKQTRPGRLGWWYVLLDRSWPRSALHLLGAWKGRRRRWRRSTWENGSERTRHMMYTYASSGVINIHVRGHAELFVMLNKQCTLPPTRILITRVLLNTYMYLCADFQVERGLLQNPSY